MVMPAAVAVRVQRLLRSRRLALTTDYSGCGYFETAVSELCKGAGAEPPIILNQTDISGTCREWLLKAHPEGDPHLFEDILKRIRPRVVQRLRRVQERCTIRSPAPYFSGIWVTVRQSAPPN